MQDRSLFSTLRNPRILILPFAPTRGGSTKSNVFKKRLALSKSCCNSPRLSTYFIYFNLFIKNYWENIKKNFKKRACKNQRKSLLYPRKDEADTLRLQRQTIARQRDRQEKTRRGNAKTWKYPNSCNENLHSSSWVTTNLRNSGGSSRSATGAFVTRLKSRFRIINY